MADYNLKELLNNNELVIVRDAINSGVTKMQLYQTLHENNYERVAHGIYAAENSLVDEMVLLHLRCPKAIFSHDEALYFHGLVDREPLRPTITLYTGYRTARLINDGVKVYTVKKELLDLGKIEVSNNFGNKVPMYNLERTIIDMIRSRTNFEIQDYSTAIKTYSQRKDADFNLLIEYAKKFRIEKYIRKYMELLL